MKNKIFLQVGDAGYSFIKKQKNFFLDDYNIVFYNLIDLSFKKDKELVKKIEEVYVNVIFCDFSDRLSIFNAIKDFREDVVGVSASADYNIKYLRRVVPFFPKLKNPNSEALKWSNNKRYMREFWNNYDKEISPNFLEVYSDSDEEIEKIEKELEYPIMIKPVNMASSKMVTKNYHREELKRSLSNIFKDSLVKALKNSIFPSEKKMEVIAEEFMEGGMYSVDGVVDDKGKIYTYPPVYIKTGKDIGYDDFFGYMQMLPSKISEDGIKKMNKVIKKAIKALSLNNSHFHIELFRTEDHGWRVIEVAPRIGGFREFLYSSTYNFSVNRNNLLNKLGLKVELNDDVENTSAVLKIYAKKEGRIKKITGLKKVKELESFVKIHKKKKIGDMAKFAKNGDGPVFIIYLKNKERGSLLGDVRKIEKILKITI